ncbi:hypothetical protein AC1031_001693 [Aphanomyces cochlioides]|nr:hypothetical protein AC1031_001693 [Aphanomyces cochlioides]
MGVSVDRTPFSIELPGSSYDKKTSWQPDNASNACTACHMEFTAWTRRRHHCRACGSLVCAECSPNMVALPNLGYTTPVRVCVACEPSSRQRKSSDSLIDDADLSTFTIDCVEDAFDEISTHSRMKTSRYFVKSEAINWLVDSKCVATRSAAARLFRRLVADGMIVQGMDSTSFMVNTALVAIDRRPSYDIAHTETSKCLNCARSYLKRMAPADGFCSIDCKTNAVFSRSDALRAEALCA